MERNLMTAEGLEALRAELEHLETVERRAIAERIKIAREWGDLKENAEYHDAKNTQAHLETKILQLRQRLDTAEVVEVTQGETVGFGSTVTVKDETSGKETTYRLVSSREADPGKGLISFESPIAAALQDKRAGDVAVFAAPRGERRLEIVSVS
ncbi:transcription elongation factor GreA [Svornostia abyssi]|uniref:Transcription elongation factor GreA n=1 Tax=Svornostia abyssi TaxID=2898438 RepID=A0ABY5PAH6_9ACTN|nr:transcription elongation factor GreA [Parviterribacteraceae bacterium J379]